MPTASGRDIKDLLSPSSGCSNGFWRLLSSLKEPEESSGENSSFNEVLFVILQEITILRTVNILNKLTVHYLKTRRL